MKKYVEIMNGRAAMVGIVAGLGAELTGHSIVGPQSPLNRSHQTVPTEPFPPNRFHQTVPS